MHRYAALLRGIAPSGKNMTNDKLRGVFDRLGFDHVGSVLSSGNVVFRSDETNAVALEARIEDALAADLGLSSRTILRSLPELQALLDSDPFPGLTHGRGTYLTVTFLKSPAPQVVLPAVGERTDIIGYHAAARAMLAVTDNSQAGQTPDFMVRLERTYGKDITTRSWLTVQRIIAKLATA